MASQISISSFGKSGKVSQGSAGGKGKVSATLGLNVRQAICALIVMLNEARAKHPRSAEEVPLLSLTTESEFKTWCDSNFGLGTIKQKLRTYIGHFNRLEGGYGPDAAYTVKDGKRRLRHDADKHLNSIKCTTIDDLK